MHPIKSLNTWIDSCGSEQQIDAIDVNKCHTKEAAVKSDKGILNTE